MFQFIFSTPEDQGLLVVGVLDGALGAVDSGNAPSSICEAEYDGWSECCFIEEDQKDA